MLEELRNKIDRIYNSNNNSNELKSRIKKEIEIIGENNLVYLLKIRDILDKNYKHSYSISGSINSFYIAYYLDITCFDPVEYEIINDSKVNVGINIREDEKDNLFNIIYKELGFIKKISNTSCDTNTDYSGFVFDENNELATYETGIVKAKKKDIIHKYLIINIYEKEILSLLNKMYYGNDNIPNQFHKEDIINFKKNINKHSKYQSPFEQIISKVNKVNIKELVQNNIYFNIKHIDQIILEYKLTFFKYHLPRTYYISYLEYLKDKANINIISKYKDDFTLFFKENKDELTLEYKFYSLWYDAKYMKDPLYDLDITTSNNKININYHNIKNIDAESIDEKFNKINEIINKNSYKEIDIFGFEGNNEYYLSNLMAQNLNIHRFQVASYLNPLGGDKTFFDSDFYKKIDENKYLELINFYRTIPLFLHTEKYDDDEEILDGILSCTDSGTEIIIIDNYEELLNLSKYTKNEILNILNKLNKEIFIFHKISNVINYEIINNENKIEQSTCINNLKDLEIKPLDINYKCKGIKYSYLEKFNEIYNDDEKLKIMNIYFLKLSLQKIKERSKTAYKIYNLTKQGTGGFVVGIVEKKDNHFDLIVASPNIIKFPVDSGYLLSAYNRAFDLKHVKKIIMSNVSTDDVTYMNNLFCELEEMEYINLSCFNTKNVSTFSEMFLDCSSIQELDLSTFYTTKIADFDCMFSGCDSLKKLMLPNLDIEKANTIYGMLHYCCNLEYIDMSNIHEKTIIEKEKDDYLFSSIPIKAKIILKGYVDKYE